MSNILESYCKYSIYKRIFFLNNIKFNYLILIKVFSKVNNKKIKNKNIST